MIRKEQCNFQFPLTFCHFAVRKAEALSRTKNTGVGAWGVGGELWEVEESETIIQLFSSVYIFTRNLWWLKTIIFIPPNFWKDSKYLFINIIIFCYSELGYEIHSLPYFITKEERKRERKTFSWWHWRCGFPLPGTVRWLDGWCTAAKAAACQRFPFACFLSFSPSLSPAASCLDDYSPRCKSSSWKSKSPERLQPCIWVHNLPYNKEKELETARIQLFGQLPTFPIMPAGSCPYPCHSWWLWRPWKVWAFYINCSNRFLNWFF